MSAVFDESTLSEDHVRIYYEKFIKLARSRFDGTTGIDKDTLIRSFNSYMYEPYIQDSTSMLSDVLQSGNYKQLSPDYSEFQVVYHNLMLKKVLRDINCLYMSGGDSLSTWLSITGLNVTDIMNMYPHEWKTIFTNLMESKTFFDRKLQDKQDQMENSLKNYGG